MESLKPDCQCARTKEVLISEGFEPHLHEYYRDEAETLEFGYNLEFVRPDVKLEIHWTFTSEFLPFPVNLSYLRPRLQSFCFEGTSMQTISPEDMLLILCVHGSKDLWQTLLMVADVAQVIRGNRFLDWQRVVEEAAALGCTRMVLLGLLLASDLLMTDIPAKIMEPARADRFAPGMVEELIQSHTVENYPLPATLGFYLRLVL